MKLKLCPGKRAAALVAAGLVTCSLGIGLAGKADAATNATPGITELCNLGNYEAEFTGLLIGPQYVEPDTCDVGSVNVTSGTIEVTVNAYVHTTYVPPGGGIGITTTTYLASATGDENQGICLTVAGTPSAPYMYSC